MKSDHSIGQSFKYAFDGIKDEFVKGRNFRIQVFTGLAAIILGIVLKISTFEWFDLCLVIASVLILELINTAIEALVDMVSPEIQDRAKTAKDVSAGAVLVASVAAIFVGALLFLPKVLR